MPLSYTKLLSIPDEFSRGRNTLMNNEESVDD